MVNAQEKYYALVAGGAKGIGYAIAEALASRQYNLILISRHIDSLSSAAAALSEKYQIKIEILAHDLSEPSAAPAIAAWCAEKQIKLKVVCNVAGLGGAQDYLTLPLDQLRYMVNLNVSSGMALNLLLLPLLKASAPSYILNVSSMAGFAPIPAKNLYAATKSAVLFYSLSLHHQLKKDNISVSCLAPGPVFTKPGIEKETNEKLGWLGRQMAVPPARLGEITVKRMFRKKRIIVPGMLSTIMSIVIRTLPIRWVAAIYTKLGQ